MNRKLLLSIFLLSTIFFLVYFFHPSNIDDSPFIEFLGDSNKFFITNVKNISEPKITLSDSKDKNFCINNKDPSKLSAKEHLSEFINGTCAPLVIIPGIIASKLQVRIDCEVLQSKNPEIFESCGWSTCSSSSFWKSRPKEEYTLWFSEVFTPMSLYSIQKKRSSCFGNLVELKFNNQTEEFEERYKEPEGVKIHLYGNTAETKKDSKCGMNAIKDYMGQLIGNLVCAANGYSELTAEYLNYGYKNGLTLQAIPYDWRRPTKYNNAQFVIERSIRFLSKMTGKKVVILAHSMGNNVALYFLNKMSQEFKDAYIAQYIALGAPFMGALKAINYEIGGCNIMNPLGMIGVPFENQKKLFGTAASIMELFPTDSFTRYKNETWMKELLQRLEDEKNHPGTSEEDKLFWKNNNNLTFKAFPTPNETCSSKFDKYTNKQCRIHISDFNSNPIIEIGKKKYFATEEDLKLIVKERIKTSDHIYELYLDILQSKLNLLINPGVPTSILYSSSYDTDSKFYYESDPEIQSMKNEFYPPDDISKEPGDETVLAGSSLIAGMKWMWEFDHKKEFDNKPKPIKIVEHCSSFNRKTEFYDSFNGKMKINEFNEYIGLKCECDDNTFDFDCRHVCQTSEIYVKKFVFDVCKTSEKVENVDKLGVSLLTENEIANIEDNCFTLGLEPKIQDILDYIIKNRNNN